MSPPAPERLPRYPALDGLRGIAILSVFLVHAFTFKSLTGPVAVLQRISSLGWLGVDLFFVLSGFLITAILLRAPPTLPGLRNFFLRRALRTWPLYYACLALGFFVFPFVPLWASADLGHAIDNQLYYWLHACNVYFALQHNWSAGFMDHFWSLAVEEQFYLLWPLAALPLRGRLIPLAALLFVPAAILLRIHLFQSHAGLVRMRVLLPDNADALILGALVAYAANRWGDRKLRLPALAVLLASAAYAAFCIATGRHGGEAFNAYVLPALLPGFAALLYLLLSPPRAVFLPLACGPLPFLGRYAYGLYVLHVFLRPLFELAGTPQQWALRAGPNAGQLLYAAIFLSLSLAAAIPCYHLYEKRWLKLKSRFP